MLCCPSFLNTKLKYICKYLLQNAIDRAIRIDGKQWACPYCPRIMIRRVEIERHILIHTGERPHKCPYCPYASNQKSALKKHIKTVHRSEYQLIKVENPTG